MDCIQSYEIRTSGPQCLCLTTHSLPKHAILLGLAHLERGSLQHRAQRGCGGHGPGSGLVVLGDPEGETEMRHFLSVGEGAGLPSREGVLGPVGAIVESGGFGVVAVLEVSEALATRLRSAWHDHEYGTVPA